MQKSVKTMSFLYQQFFPKPTYLRCREERYQESAVGSNQQNIIGSFNDENLYTFLDTFCYVGIKYWRSRKV